MIKDREHVSKKNATITERLTSGLSRKDEKIAQVKAQQDEDLKSMIGSLKTGDNYKSKKQR